MCKLHLKLSVLTKNLKLGLDTLLFLFKNVYKALTPHGRNLKNMAAKFNFRGTYQIIDNHQETFLIFIVCIPSSAEYS